MKIQFDTKLANIDGSISQEAPTLKEVSIGALVVQLPADERASGEDKFKRASLAHKIQAGETDLTIEEVALVKTRIGEAYAPVVVFAAWNLLEGN